MFLVAAVVAAVVAVAVAVAVVVADRSSCFAEDSLSTTLLISHRCCYL